MDTPVKADTRIIATCEARAELAVNLALADGAQAYRDGRTVTLARSASIPALLHCLAVCAGEVSN